MLHELKEQDKGKCPIWNEHPTQKESLPSYITVSSRAVGVLAKARSGLVGWLDPWSSLLILKQTPDPETNHNKLHTVSSRPASRDPVFLETYA